MIHVLVLQQFGCADANILQSTHFTTERPKKKKKEKTELKFHLTIGGDFSRGEGDVYVPIEAASNYTTGGLKYHYLATSCSLTEVPSRPSSGS